MHATESAAIAATLDTAELMRLVREVAGRDVGDPNHNPHDSAALRDQFGITIELSDRTVFAFNDDGMCTALPLGQVFRLPAIGRRATCVAVASMWNPTIRKARGITAQAKEGA